MGPPRDVFVIGAGFSRAISDHMPLTTELFDKLVVALRELNLETADDTDVLGAYPRLARDMETWLTWMASDHPWLQDAGGFRNRAAFSDVTAALAKVILESENNAIASSVRDDRVWIEDLLHSWVHLDAAVISLNYDALVEKVYDEIQGPSVALYSFWPTPLSGAGRWGGTPGYRFDLFKLHGSITWYVFPGDPGAAAPIFDADLNNGWTTPDDVASLIKRVGARRALIVPPVVTKDQYFTRPELRDQWMRADYRLAGADRLFLVGYSLPRGDLTMRFLLDRCPLTCKVFAVNPSSAFATHVEELLGPRSVDHSFTGHNLVVREFAAWYSEPVVRARAAARPSPAP